MNHPDAPSQPAVVLVLPDYDPNATTHYLHLYERIEALARQTPVVVVFERAAATPRLRGVHDARVLRWTWPGLSLAERFWTFLRLRLAGHRRFYVHYSYFSALPCALVTRLSGGRLFYWNCETFENYGADKRGPTRLKWRLTDDWPLRLCLKLCDRLVTGAASVGRRYTELFGVPAHKIAVAPSGIRIERFNVPAPKAELRRQLGLPADAPVVVFVHWLSARKGADLLPAIAQRVLRDRPDTFFVVIGDGPLRAMLQQEIEDRKLAGRVRLTGAVPNTQLPDYLRAADAALMPSRQEGFPRVLLEYMAAGLPFVSTAVGAVAEIVPPEYQPWLVAPAEAAPVGDMLVRLLNDDASRRLLAGAGLRRVQRFSNDLTAAAFAKVLLS